MVNRFVIIILIIILAFLFGLFFSKIVFTGNVVSGQYTWTKAICGNYGCLDVEITCLNGRAVKMVPVSNMQDIVFNVSDSLCE